MHKSTFAQIPLFQLPFSSLRVLCRRGQRKQRTQGDLEQKKEREKEPKNKVAFTKHYCKTLPKAQRPRGLIGSYTNLDQISSSEQLQLQNFNQTSASGLNLNFKY